MNKKIKCFIKVLMPLLVFMSLYFTSLGGEESWRGGDFSDIECGEVIIHVTFSESTREVLGTCEDPIDIHIESEGTWWTYGGYDRYSDLVPVIFDKSTGYQVRKKLPYGKYVIHDLYYKGETLLSQSSMEYLSYMNQPEHIFEISKEVTEIPVFIDIKKREKIYHEEAELDEGNTEYWNKYSKVFDEFRKQGIDPYGQVQFHAERADLGCEYFIVVELEDMRSQEVGEIHYFGKTNDYTYTTQMYPGLYRIQRVSYINQEGSVLAQDKAIREYEFEVLPQCNTIKINFNISENEETISSVVDTELPKETGTITLESQSAEINNKENQTVINKQNALENQILIKKRIIIYRVIAFCVVVGLIGCGIYFRRIEKK